MKRLLMRWMLCCILSVASLAFSQSANTSLRGVITDSSGALVPGASITLSNSATGSSYKAVADAAGYYIFPIVPPARYVITLSSTGFAAQTRTADLLVDQPATINFTLSV
ncbi:carboxypeptidase-like regulatory domain-containing protein, partial [Terracidiphilus sp.]|uniref:carboxypeptidase-like regulatory domain-containing protein n=1 Tax=Terracidiphilus sp. TaxID=1964191 RepID=UPI003C26FE9F